MAKASSDSGSVKSINYQIFAPKDGDIDIVLDAYFPVGNIDSTSTGGSKGTYSGYSLNVELAYGISEHFALAVKAGTMNQKLTNNTTPETTTTSSGLSDFEVGVKGLFLMDSGFFYYDLKYIAPFTKPQKLDAATGEITPGSIRPALNANVVFGKHFWTALTYGAKLGIFSLQEGSMDAYVADVFFFTTKYKSGTGSTWQVFLQSNTRWKFGIAYEQFMTDKYDIEVLGVQAEVPGSTRQRPLVYMIAPIMSSAEFFLTVAKPRQSDSASVYNLYDVEAKLKFSF